MWINQKGFSMIEMLMAWSLMMLLVGTALPIQQLLQVEKQVLKNRHTVQMALHHQLTEQLTADVPEMADTNIQIGHQDVQISYEEKVNYLEGCARWANEKKQNEKVCLYGIRPK